MLYDTFDISKYKIIAQLLLLMTQYLMVKYVELDILIIMIKEGLGEEQEKLLPQFKDLSIILIAIFFRKWIHSTLFHI